MRKPFGLLLLICALSRTGWSQIYVQPEPQNARSLAVVIDDSALVHTTQVRAENPSQLLDRLDDVLKLAGTDLHSIVKWNIYLADEADLGPMQQEILKRLDASRLPASMVVQTQLPDNAQMAIDAVAITHQRAMKPVNRLGEGRFAVLPPGARPMCPGKRRREQI